MFVGSTRASCSSHRVSCTASPSSAVAADVAAKLTGVAKSKVQRHCQHHSNDNRRVAPAAEVRGALLGRSGPLIDLSLPHDRGDSQR